MTLTAERRDVVAELPMTHAAGSWRRDAYHIVTNSISHGGVVFKKFHLFQTWHFFSLLFVYITIKTYTLHYEIISFLSPTLSQHQKHQTHIN